jgi:hypothetical protein
MSPPKAIGRPLILVVLSPPTIPAFLAVLSGANLLRCDLSGAYLSRSDLSGAKLYGAKLYGVDLFGAYLSRANLSRANLSRAKLLRCDLSGANLSGAVLTEANLTGAIILKPIDFKDLTIYDETKFNTAITDDIDFFYFLESKIKTRNLPILVESKECLVEELKKRSYDDDEINGFIIQSKFA